MKYRLMIVIVALAAASCGSSSDKTAAVVVPHVFDLNVDPAAAIVPADPSRTNVLPADQLREVIDRDLAWHGVTLAKLMQEARRGTVDVQDWVDQLVSNTADLTGAIGLAYGRDAARAFNQQWAQHTQFLVDYAVAISNGDTSAANEAKDNLTNYTQDSGTFFATVTSGGLAASAVTELLATHVAHMIAMIDADQAGDPTIAVAAAVSDASYLATIGQALSSAIAAQQPTVFPGSTDTAPAALCSNSSAEPTPRSPSSPGAST